MTRKVSILIKHLSSVFQQVEFLGSVVTHAFCWRRSYHYSGNGPDFCFIFPQRFPKWHQVLSIERSIMINIFMYQPASHLLLHLLLQNFDVSTTQGDSRGSLATPQWGEVAGVPNITGGAAVSKLYQTYLKSKHDTIHKKWTRWEKDIFERKTMNLWRVSMFLFRGCLIEGWSVFPVSSRPLSLVPFCWTNPSWLWATSKPLLACPKAEDFATIY